MRGDNPSGGEPGEYYLSIAHGTCTFCEGIADHATTTITTPAEVWLAIARGDKDGGQAMMQGLYTVSGDFGLMMQMEGPPPPASGLPPTA